MCFCCCCCYYRFPPTTITTTIVAAATVVSILCSQTVCSVLLLLPQQNDRKNQNTLMLSLPFIEICSFDSPLPRKLFSHFLELPLHGLRSARHGLFWIFHSPLVSYPHATEEAVENRSEKPLLSIWDHQKMSCPSLQPAPLCLMMGLSSCAIGSAHLSWAGTTERSKRTEESPKKRTTNGLPPLSVSSVRTTVLACRGVARSSKRNVTTLLKLLLLNGFLRIQNLENLLQI